MTRAELNKMIEDEVMQVVSEPMREPVVNPVHTPPKPVLTNEDEIDDYLFRVGKKKETPYRFGEKEKEKEIKKTTTI